MGKKTNAQLKTELRASKASLKKAGEDLAKADDASAQLEAERDEAQEKGEKLQADLKISEQQRFEITAGETHFRNRCKQLYALVGRLTCQISELAPSARVLDVVPDPETYEFPEDFQVSVKVNISPEAAKKIEADKAAAQKKAKAKKKKKV